MLDSFLVHVLLAQFKPEGSWKETFPLMEEITSQTDS